MDTSWSAIAANVGGFIVSILGMIAYFKRSIKNEAKAAIAESAVGKEQYTKDREAMSKERDAMWHEINQIKKFDSEFGVMKTKIEHVQASVEEVKQSIKDTAERQSNELTGAMNTMRLTMVDFVNASTRK